MNKAFAKRAAALTGVAAADDGLAKAKNELETASVFFTNQGLADNDEATRRAELAKKVADEKGVLEEAERTLRQAKLRLDLADNEVERLRVLGPLGPV